ncbi:MAG: hypothetical protein KDI10_02520, partial [Halioglobus sp.]|nr:hypothetical protein [Halioglobus sp.]
MSWSLHCLPPGTERTGIMSPGATGAQMGSRARHVTNGYGIPHAWQEHPGPVRPIMGPCLFPTGAREMTDPNQLSTLLAKQAIQECIYRYCRALDRLDTDLLASVFD